MHSKLKEIGWKTVEWTQISIHITTRGSIILFDNIGGERIVCV